MKYQFLALTALFLFAGRGEDLRFRAECRLAGELYGQAFGVDDYSELRAA
jgi:hypothetical protein